MKTILITGSCSGIGRRTAELAHQKDYQVILHDIRESEASKETLQAIPGAKIVFFNIADREAVKTGMEEIKTEYGSLDVLVNNAGINKGAKPLLDLSDEEILEDYSVNVLGHMHVVQESLDLIRDGGHIVNITSFRGIPHMVGSRSLVYSMHKAAMVAFTVGLAKTLAERNIKVNAVAPGHTKTEFSEKFWADGTEENSISKSLADRVATPEDIAETVLFLAETEHMFGQNILVDGGYSIANT